MKVLRKASLLFALSAGCFCAVNPASAETNLIHRWSFNEVGGTTVTDSVGGQNGTLMVLMSNSIPRGALPTLNGTEVTMDGLGGYVDLGNGIFSGLTNCTIEIWFRFLDNSSNWVNLLTAGAISTNSTPGGPTGALEDNGGANSLRNDITGGNYYGASGLFITPRSGAGGNVARFGISRDTNATFNLENPQLNSLAALDNDTALGGFPNYVAVTYGPDGQRFFNFNFEQSWSSVQPPDYINLSELNDINIWLGRSLFGVDPMLNATINEVRIHDTILTGPEIATSYFNGAVDPNVVSYDPGALSALDGSTTINPVMSQTQTQPLRVNGTFANIAAFGAIPVSLVDLDYAYVTDTNVLQIIDGRILALADGNSTVHFGLDGISNSVNITVSTTPPELVHRWSFSETNGLILADSQGGSDATIVDLSGTNQVSGGGGHALGGGQLRLFGGGKDTSDYIDLVDNIFSASSLSNMSIEAWVTPHSAQNWARLFDFGSGTGDTWFLSVCRGGNINQQRFAHSGGFADRDTSLGTTPGQEYHYVIVYGGGRAAWYRNGALIAEATGLTSSPLNLTATNNWLGRSQWPDNTIDGSFNEVRFYRGALLPLNIALNGAAGPDAIAPDPGALVSIRVESDDILLGNPAATQAQLLGNFQNINDVNLVPLGGSLSSGDPSVITVDANGFLTAVGTNGQSATISGTYFQEPVTPDVVTILGPTNLVMNLATSALGTGDLPVNATALADYNSPGLQGMNVNTFNGVVWSTTDPSVLSVTAFGQVGPVGPGTAWAVVTYGGMAASNQVTVSLSPGYSTPALAHRYSFTTNADDSVGTAHGILVDGALLGSPVVSGGQLVLNNPGFTGPSSDANCLSLPPSILPTSGSVTLEEWFTVAGSGFWCASWTFSDQLGTNSPGAGVGQYFMHTLSNPQGGPNPAGGGSSIVQATSGFGAGGDESRCYSTYVGIGAAGGGGYLDNNVTFYAATVIDGSTGTLKYYVYRVSDGAGGLMTGIPAIPLSSYSFNEAYLGRSAFDGDNSTAGSINEFRIWNGALVGADVAASFAAGPDAAPITPIAGRPKLTITLAAPNVIISWPVSATGFHLEVATAVSGPYGTGGLPAPTVVGDENQVTVPASALVGQYFRLSDAP